MSDLAPARAAAADRVQNSPRHHRGQTTGLGRLRLRHQHNLERLYRRTLFVRGHGSEPKRRRRRRRTSNPSDLAHERQP